MNGLDLDLTFALEPAGSLFVPSGAGPHQALRLTDSFLFVFVARGDLVMCSEKCETRLRTGDAFLHFRRGACGVAFHHGPETEFYALKFRSTPRPSRAAGRSLRVPSRGTVNRPERLTDLLRRYVAEQKRKSSAPGILYNLLVLVLCEFSAAAEGAREDRSASSGLETITSMVDAYIAAHYREPIGTCDIARELRYSPGYLERAYRRERGISVRSAIHLRRIREARAQLLLQRERHVAEIAAQCGYGDVAYFRRVFKRTTNMTPVRFRAINGARGTADLMRVV